MKIAIIGAGSPYVPVIVDSLLLNKRIETLSEVILIAPSNKNISVIGDFCVELVKLRRRYTKIILKNEIDDAISGSDLIINLFRIGGMQSRSIEEKLGKEFEIIGQESQGLGGFSSALRNIEQLKIIASKIRKYAHSTKVLNLTNPAGIMTLASIKLGLDTVGFCDAPYNLSKSIAKFVNLPLTDLKITYIGLNHLGWVIDVCRGNNSLLNEIINSKNIDDFIQLLKLSNVSPPKFMQAIMQALNAIPSPYVLFYYQPDDIRQVLSKSEMTRGEEVEKINEKIFEKYRQKELSTWPKYVYENRSGYLLGEALSEFLADLFFKSEERTHIVCMPNNRIVENLADDSVIETSVKIVDGKLIPLRNSIKVDGQMKALITTLSEYEMLTVNAALKGNKQMAFQALATHPHINSIDKAGHLMDRVIREFKDYLTDFK